MPSPHPIGRHALLADRRTAALVDPDGNVAWLCWPRFDADPCLLGILDPDRGGRFVVRPRDPDAHLLDRGSLDDPGLAVTARAEWAADGGRLVVDDALVLGPRPRLVRAASAHGAPVRLAVRLSLAPDWGRAPGRWRIRGTDALFDGGGLALRVAAPSRWQAVAEGVECEVLVEPGRPVAVVLEDGATGPDRTSSSPDPPDADPDRGGLEAIAAVERTREHWREVARTTANARLGRLAIAVLGEAASRAAIARSAVVLAALRYEAGGVVAAPTSSLPQWPGSARTWDYRYAWLRDTSLAAMALARIGLVDDARALGEFCAAVGEDGHLPVLRRVDGGEPPEELAFDHLAGYGGARPVRQGNAAASQAQVDVFGEVLDLAWSLWRGEALPASLARAAPRIADRLSRIAILPDHGIWEVRGRPRRYAHSAIMAWCGLRRAAALARRGVVARGAEPWEEVAAALQREVLAHVGPTGPLQLHVDGSGGADAALAVAPLVGFLAPDDPRATATLAAIEDELAAPCGLVHRYRGERDDLADFCAPFVFATFWLASARERCTGDGRSAFAAAARACGERGLFGEVADPLTGEPLGNYPQVQSHAAFLLAAAKPAR